MSVRILIGDVRDKLKELADESVHCVVTSPPYWGLRDYGTAQWEGGDQSCGHKIPAATLGGGGNMGHEGSFTANYKSTCGKCGARRIDSQLGIEPTYQEHVDAMVSVFREVKRVLRKDGTLWLNYGDSYATQPAGNAGDRRPFDGGVFKANKPFSTVGGVLKPKDLCGIPWRVAFALQADGWVLRQEIIWAKPNPMPESVKDRCTKAHESIFLFAKARWSGDRPPRAMNPSDARWLALLLETEGNVAVRRYTHNRGVPQHALQIAIANSDRTILEAAQSIAGCGSILTAKGTNRPVHYLQWTTKEASVLLWEMYPYLFGKKRQAAIGLMLEDRRSNTNKGKRDDIFRKEGRHFYLQPVELELREKMWKAVKALNKHQAVDLSWLKEPREGNWTPEKYYFDAEAIREAHADPERGDNEIKEDYGGHRRRPDDDLVIGWKIKNDGSRVYNPAGRNKRSVWEIATSPFPEAHFATFPPELPEICIKAGSKAGDTILDPFGGAGTTGLVADRLQRNAILIELNPSYAELARKRIYGDAPMFAEVST